MHLVHANKGWFIGKYENIYCKIWRIIQYFYWRASITTIKALARGYSMYLPWEILKRRKQNAKDLTQGSYASHMRFPCGITSTSSDLLPASRVKFLNIFKRSNCHSDYFPYFSEYNLSKNFIVTIKFLRGKYLSQIWGIFVYFDK